MQKQLTNKKQLVASEAAELIKDAWLGIHVNEATIFNPMAKIPAEFEDNPHMYILWLMQRPEYFSFICREILNVELLPIQALMLREMWQRRFPMLIASRGFGKAMRLDEVIQTPHGWIKMRDIQIGTEIYSRSGEKCRVTAIYPQGKKQICKITLLDGRTIECCEDHLWIVKEQEKEKVVDTKTIINLGVKYDQSHNGGNVYKYKIPNCEAIQFDKKDLPIDPYILGCLLGDGCLTTSTPKIASDDIFIIEEFKKRLDGFELKKDNTNNNYTIVDKNKDYSDCVSSKGKIYQQRNRNRLTTLIHSIKLNVKCDKKFIPESYKYSSIADRMELVRGLMDTDGSINTNGSIEFTNTCEQLVDDLIEVLRSLGITCKKTINDRSGQKMVLPQGTDFERRSYFRVLINTSQPIFKLPRKLNRIKTKPTQAEKYVSIVDARYIDEYVDMQCISIDSEDHTYITKDYIVTHNSFMLAVYALLRILLLPTRRVVICGAAFRQSKVIFDYMDAIWKNAPLLRDMVGSTTINGPKRDVDMCRFHIADSVAIALPIGDGQKIRGQRANDIISDEFAATSRDVFENVIAGFGVVRASPIEAVKERAEKDLAKKLGIAIPYATSGRQDNQIILSGTAYYDFNHFGEYWKRWRSIIRSKGKPDKLSTVFGEENVPTDFNWMDYSIIRLPFELIPKGFMDEAMVARSKATIHSGIYLMEFGAVFSNDSNGFFKRSLIESCVLSNNNEIILPSGPVSFSAMLRGRTDREYIISVDPASEVDNCAICVLEHHQDHRRIVYMWTITRKEHKERIRLGLTRETDFYAFIARRVRDLMKLFPCKALPIDTQGGGIALMESLHDLDKIEEGELPIWPIIDPEKPNPDTDGQPGLHIIHPINFSSADWTSEANHGLRKDFEDKVCIFPFFDSLSLGLAAINDEQGNFIYDTLEDCLLNIEELKNELSTIIITQTLNGRDRWDTPEVKLPGNKKGRLRKDRYSALLMANMVSRQLARNPFVTFGTTDGGFAKNISPGGGRDYIGSAWLSNAFNGIYD